MVGVLNKWAIELRCKEGRWKQNIIDRSTRFEACKVSTRSCRLYKMIEEIKNQADIR